LATDRTTTTIAVVVGRVRHAPPPPPSPDPAPASIGVVSICEGNFTLGGRRLIGCHDIISALSSDRWTLGVVSLPRNNNADR